MTTLALEFSSGQRSVAVVRHGAGDASFVTSEVVETGAGGTRALGMIEGALREAGLEREQIDVIAVGLGPGSYTGIRAALSLAQGWQLACRDGGMKLLGVSSAECVAAQAQAEKIYGRVNVVIDAQRNEFYLAAYEISASGRKEVEPLRILTRVEVESRAGAKESLIGPEVTRWFPNGRMVFPRAAVLGQLALSRSDFVPGDKLEPIYLRETNFAKAPPSRRIAT
ncbi:MAG: tRNA (adenosine(37)-N6)-threonylcarbamoyltransferase complex dimerization subunit type 1 TsaB [Limisphaerales bacterium]